MFQRLRTWGHWSAILVVLIVGAELAARVDDWIHNETPLWASPNRDRDLMVAETWGYRGRPNGSFRKWHLNQFGFRGPDVTREPSPSRPRIVVLGASETFGLYEDEGKEYPAQLRRLLAKDDSFEVVNAALAGISIKSMIPYWDHWVSGFRPHKVILYPSPHFYLDEKPPTSSENPSPPCGGMRPRLAERIRDVYRSMPDWVKAWREDWEIQRQTVGKPNDWLFTAPPLERLDLFVKDVTALVEQVCSMGAKPVLVTHAHSAADPARPEDEVYLRKMRISFPRATPATMIAFEKQANVALRELGRQRGIRVIDVDATMSGQQMWFADLVHFNNNGAARIAKILADELQLQEREKQVPGHSLTEHP
jgi:hypothetical protein